MSKPLKFALFGTGFWSRFQLAAWRELPGVECVALYNRTPERAHQLAQGLAPSARVYSDPAELLSNETLDFADVVTNVETHREIVQLSACKGVPVICQKPMAPTLPEAAAMVQIAQRHHVPFFIHENWRWQTPIRRVHQILSSGVLGHPYRARIRMVSGFPVFDNQPFLKTLDRFLLMDIGSHILDVARFLFGEAQSVYCTAARIQAGIAGEDIATVVLNMQSGSTVICEMGYPGTPLAHDHFPQTLAFIECENGSVELAANYRLHITTKSGTETVDAPPPPYSWAHPAYEVVHSSIVACHRNLLDALRGVASAETTAEDNLRTMQVVFAAYESAETNQVVSL